MPPPHTPPHPATPIPLSNGLLFNSAPACLPALPYYSTGQYSSFEAFEAFDGVSSDIGNGMEVTTSSNEVITFYFARAVNVTGLTLYASGSNLTGSNTIAINFYAISNSGWLQAGRAMGVAVGRNTTLQKIYQKFEKSVNAIAADFLQFKFDTQCSVNCGSVYVHEVEVTYDAGGGWPQQPFCALATGRSHPCLAYGLLRVRSRVPP